MAQQSNALLEYGLHGTETVAPNELAKLVSPSQAEPRKAMNWVRIYLGGEQITSGIRGVHGGVAFIYGNTRSAFGLYVDFASFGYTPSEEKLYDFHPSAFNDPIVDPAIEEIKKWSSGIIVHHQALYGILGGGARTRKTFTKLRDPLEILSADGIYYVHNDDSARQASFDFGAGIALSHRLAVQWRRSIFISGSSNSVALGYQIDMNDRN